MPQYRGGSLAPALTPAHVTKYRQLAESAEPQVKGIMETLLATADEWLANGGPSKDRRGGEKLAAKDIASLDATTPWLYEVKAMLPIIGELPKGDLKDAAHHLAWLAWELTNDVEPRTADEARIASVRDTEHSNAKRPITLDPL